MPVANPTQTSRDKVRLHRERLRSAGLRPIQFWVPDVHSAAFRAEAERQCKLLAQSEHAADDQAFVDSLNDWFDDPRTGWDDSPADI